MPTIVVQLEDWGRRTGGIFGFLGYLQSYSDNIVNDFFPRQGFQFFGCFASDVNVVTSMSLKEDTELFFPEAKINQQHVHKFCGFPFGRGQA